MPLLMKVAERGEWLLYRIGGLPVAVRGGSDREADRPCDIIRRGYSRVYWRPDTWGGYIEIGAAWLLWPFVLLLFSLWFTAKNGPEIRRRSGRRLAAQFADQVKLYFSDGILSPWYYIFELFDDPEHSRAELFLQRSETKGGIYPLLRRGVTSELNDKRIFSEHCAEKGVPTIPALLYFDGRGETGPLPDCDLFVKVANGRGGRGAERWDLIGERTFSGPGGLELAAGDLRDRLNEAARRQPLLVQKRLGRHRELLDLTTGALPTVRSHDLPG